MAETGVRRARWPELDPVTLHDLVRLRIDVFVVEQNCPYPELDGRDVDQATEHVWLVDDRGPSSYLRILAEADGSRRIGRVCTRADARGRGLAGVLIDAVLADPGSGPGTDPDENPGNGEANAVTFVLDAQTYVAGFYATRGFVVSGPEFVEDGIPHVPMRRTGLARASLGRDHARPHHP
jgi:ElaA protein